MQRLRESWLKTAGEVPPRLEDCSDAAHPSPPYVAASSVSRTGRRGAALQPGALAFDAVSS
jgi:hypothetical protein